MNRALLPLLAFCAACADDTLVIGTLNNPGHIAVLQADAGPFDEPVGYAADKHGGMIRALALARPGNYLSSGIASFFPARAISTGRDRILGQVAARATDDAVTVIAADLRHKSLFSIPHVLGRTDSHTMTYPEPAVVTSVTGAATITWVDADLGRAADETWRLTYTDQGSYEVRGSRSGLQIDRAFLGAPYLADNNTIAFQIDGEAAIGDTIEIDVDLGLIEVEVEGTPVALTLSPDQQNLAVVQHSPPSLTWRDPVALTESAEVTLPAGSTPQRMAWNEDGSTLFVASTGVDAALEIAPGGTDVIVHPLPWPIFDLAPLQTDEGRRLLYVAPVGDASVWLLDLDTDQLIDINPYTAEIDGMRFLSPVQGLESLHEAYTFPFLDEDESTSTGRSVAVSLHEGKVVWMEESTGCLVKDPSGPRTAFRSVTSSLFDIETNFSITDNTAQLAIIEDGSRHVFVNPCAGVARRESWEITFDRLKQGWIARGEQSGIQSSVIYEDSRWVSDDGGIHLMMQSGAVASQDDWSILFQVVDGVLDADGDNNEDGQRTEVPNFDLPGEPATFYAVVEGERRPMVAVSATSGDIIARIDATTGEIDGIWE